MPAPAGLAAGVRAGRTESRRRKALDSRSASGPRRGGPGAAACDGARGAAAGAAAVVGEAGAAAGRGRGLAGAAGGPGRGLVQVRQRRLRRRGEGREPHQRVRRQEEGPWGRHGLFWLAEPPCGRGLLSIYICRQKLLRVDPRTLERAVGSCRAQAGGTGPLALRCSPSRRRLQTVARRWRRGGHRRRRLRGRPHAAGGRRRRCRSRAEGLAQSGCTSCNRRS